MRGHPTAALDSATAELALECYLDDFEDLRIAPNRPHDPADPLRDWEDVKGEPLGYT